MSGIYIHIPYCRQKCSYCNFFSLATGKYREELVPALLKELEIQKDYLKGSGIGTIYFGGGTPSLLTGKEILSIIEQIDKLYGIESGAEITLEANPDDLTPEKLLELKITPVNRMSIGIQSFHDEDLIFLNRSHSGNDGYKCIQRVKDSGYHNLSLDLIYGIPGLTSSKWQRNLELFLELDIPHLSAYALTVEEKTPLAVQIRKGQAPKVEDTLQSEHFEILSRFMESAGYLHYEISNFSKPDCFSRHNTSYWKGVHYLGIGPSAHSYNGESRQWNVSNLGQYISGLQKGEIPFEKEILTLTQQFNEYIMTSLRTMWGCDLKTIRQSFPANWETQLISEANPFAGKGLLNIEHDNLKLTQKGKFRADGIASALFRDDDSQD
ncbi:MAG: radical SAM family heme chaperone HemW [Bacteroidales bacterium]|nr:radical SAM family heme chaperone HemW [Bacteroidales bacterium]